MNTGQKCLRYAHCENMPAVYWRSLRLRVEGASPLGGNEVTLANSEPAPCSLITTDQYFVNTMKISAFSDSHTMHRQVEIPDGDILIFAGDISNCRTSQDVSDFNSFLGTLPHRHKVVVAGNHDHLLAGDPDRAQALLPEAIYLQDKVAVLDGITVYGAPWQPKFNDRACDAFALPRGRALEEKWAMIPDGVDILVTHAPPAGVMDQDGPVCHGCSDLNDAIQVKQPTLHVFGHIHNRHGILNDAQTTFMNCNVQQGGSSLRSALSFQYDPQQRAISAC